MFAQGNELMVPCGTPAQDLDGKRIRGGVPFDQTAHVISSVDRGMAVVRTNIGKLYVVNVADLLPPMTELPTAPRQHTTRSHVAPSAPGRLGAVLVRVGIILSVVWTAASMLYLVLR
jgi:hypothetical protein